MFSSYGIGFLGSYGIGFLVLPWTCFLSSGELQGCMWHVSAQESLFGSGSKTFMGVWSYIQTYPALQPAVASETQVISHSISQIETQVQSYLYKAFAQASKYGPFLQLYITESSITYIKKTLKTTFPRVHQGSVMVPWKNTKNKQSYLQC